MRKLTLGLIAPLFIVCGCGGGGTTSHLKFVITQTTFTGNLKDANDVQIGTITTVVKPDNTYTMTSTYGPGFTINGPLQVGSAGDAALSFFFVPDAAGTFQGDAVTPSTTYTGGGHVTLVNGHLQGGFQFGSNAQVYPESFFDGDVAG